MKQILLISCLLFSQDIASSREQPRPSDADRDWVEERLREAWDIVLPLAVEYPSVVYRSSRDRFMATAESYFAIKFGPRPESFLASAEGRLLTLVGGSLREQLSVQRAADREAPLNALLLRVNVRRNTFTPANCNGFKERLEEFSRLLLPMVPKPKNSIALHATSHQVVISVPRQYLDVRADEESPLIGWALRTRETLHTCASPVR
jgi:hypothetical protein